MTEHFDAIIVGSGFGGSVMAYRLAEAGKRVCVLERGKAYPPGSFPRTPDKMRSNFWGPKEGLHGMFDLWSFRHLGAVVSSGLGGGSLIYANVLIRKDARWFVTEDLANGGFEHWPVTRADLDPHYERAERMLCAQKYPFELEPYARTPKTIALKTAAETLQRGHRYQPGEVEWHLPNLAVTFGNAGETPAVGVPIKEPFPNLHGKPRSTCRLCGECDIGCNYGSKNTLDFTYLSAARNQKTPADIRTNREVKRIAPREGGGYLVTFVNHEASLPGESPVMETATCDRLVLSAGAIGTPYLLLKNKSDFPNISPRLGTRFGSNGDVIGLARRCASPIEPSNGPVTTSAVRVADAADGGGIQGRGLYVEDGGFPAFVAWMILAANVPSSVSRAAHFATEWLGDHFGQHHHANISGQLAALVGDGGEASSLMVLLGMGRDLPTGTMTLTSEGDLDLDWKVDDSRAYFARMRSVMSDLSDGLGGRFTEDPISYLSRSITVHPLGGCPMGRTPNEGVVDSHGEVFGYPGLYIADGSVMPGPVGPNPSLTIAALADRFADRMLT